MTESRFCIDGELLEQGEELIKQLRDHGLSVVTAESCTGGLIAAALSHAPGASECLHGGFVVYTKESKTVALGVPRALLDQSGAVNAQVAQELASGALARSSADIVIAVTGVLGPHPDEDGNPPGQVYFGVLRRGRQPRVLAEYYTGDDPHQVRRAVVLRALALLREAAGS
jgi:nicotinamide-nucleotide amidase